MIAKQVLEYRKFREGAEPFRALMDEAAKRHSISRHVLAALLFVESSFNPNAVGKIGEVGLGQFTPIAAEDISISMESLDNNPEAQIFASAKFLALLIRRTRSTYDGIRSYNVGQGNAQKDNTAGLGYYLKVINWAITDKLLLPLV